MCKSVLFKDGELVKLNIMRTGWNPLQSAQTSLSVLLAAGGISRESTRVIATGYGRESITFADKHFTEITCHGLGADFLEPGTGGVIDIGGQDSKVIRLENGRVADFLMNDKCAAGTGRFLAMACDAIGIELTEIDNFVNPHESVHITSMCTVFAESEIISLLAASTDRSQILAGVLESIAQRARQMVARVGFEPSKPLLMTGGLAQSRMLVDAISKASGFEVKTHKYAQFAGAIGACLKGLS